MSDIYNFYDRDRDLSPEFVLQKFKQFQDVFSHHPCLVFRVAGRQTASIVMRRYFDKLLLPEEADLYQLVSVSTITWNITLTQTQQDKSSQSNREDFAADVKLSSIEDFEGEPCIKHETAVPFQTSIDHVEE